MNSSEFIQIRNYLRKSQSQIARLLGISTRAVQSFEQGWRRITASTERQMLLLLSLKKRPSAGVIPCWQIKGCDPKTRRKCPAWELRGGHICWLINGTICEGTVQENWNIKMQVCRQCGILRSLFSNM